MVECQNCQQLEQALRDARTGIAYLEQGIRRQGCCDGRHHMRERRASMRQFIMGCIRQLTTRKEHTPPTEPVAAGTAGMIWGGGRRRSGPQAQEGTEPFVGEPRTTKDGEPLRHGPLLNRFLLQKQLNILIQSAATDIVTRLITADVILSQQAERVEEIVGDMLHRAFEGATLATAGWLTAWDTSHAFHQELKLRSIHCTECQTDTSVDWLS